MVSVRSVNTIFLKLRKRIVQECGKQTPFSGVIELDESYCEPKRLLGVRARGVGGKTIVFSNLKRNAKVNTELVLDESKTALIKMIRGHVSIEKVFHTYGCRGYNGLC